MEARRLDGNAREIGIPVERLMARAGEALATQVTGLLGRTGAAWVLCGKGDNGGDGFACAAALLESGKRVRVWLLEPASQIRSDAARLHFARLPPDVVTAWRRAPGPAPAGTVVVDCMLGSGIQGTPRGVYANAIRWTNRQRRARRKVVSCDVPSGWPGALAVRPHATVTMHAPKVGMDAASCGRIVVADIGIPRRAGREIGMGDLDVAYRRAGHASHKGQNGVVLLVAGGPYTGAAHYTGMAAYRAGADLVLLVTPAQAAATIASWGPDLIIHPTPDRAWLTPAATPTVLELLPRAGAVAIGPGVGRHDDTLELVRQVVVAAAQTATPVVVDADGLAALDDKTIAAAAGRLVLTPHRREAEELTGKGTDAHIRTWARARGVVVLRKGEVDLVAGPDGWRSCRRGHPTMTVGGTGDVLTGAVATLLARGADAMSAASAAAYLVGCAGELAGSQRGPGASATDVLERIPDVLLRLDAPR